MIRVRRWVAAAVLGGAVAPMTACNPMTSGSPGDAGDKPAPSATHTDIGGDLYKPTPAPKPADAAGMAADPIVVANAVVQNNDRVQIAAQVDAKIELLAVPLEPNEKVMPERIVYHPRDTERKKPYRRLMVGDLISKDQTICRLDDQLVEVQVVSLRNTIRELKLAIEEGIKAEKATEKIADAYVGVRGVADTERWSNLSLVARYKENRIQSQKELAKTEGELVQAETQTGRYWIQSQINGRVVKLLKNQGEYAKAGDPILEVQATDRVRIEGKLDIGYGEVVRPGMRVLVEPSRPVSPTGPSVSHRQEVTGVCVTGHAGRPLVVSGGLDNAAIIWEAAGGKSAARLPHPTPVRSVAATGRGVKAQMVATGGDDGVIRMWDVSNPDRLSTRDLDKYFPESHGAAVTALAFSPDGRFLASAAGRDVWVWSVAEKKKLYQLPGDHRDAVTSLRFTPQATLVTAARDKAVRVWKLGDKGAALAALMDHRGGAVDVLGVSTDGGKVLFDKDAGRLDVVNLADERPLGSLQASGGRFAGLALFSPDDGLILTAGGEADQRGELAVWEAPQPGGRAVERRRLLTRGGQPVTCAAFSPDPDKPFVVAGTADGLVSTWAVPAAAERGRQMVAEVVSVMPADARTVTLSVEMANPTDQFPNGLADRSLATIILTPGSEPAAPPAVVPPLVKPAGGVAPMVGGVVPAGGTSPAATRGPSEAPPKPLPPAAAPSGVTVPPVPAPGGLGSGKK